MKRITKIIIIIILILSVIGIWGYKTYFIEKASNQPTEDVGKDKPMLVDLGATTCIPCKEMVPVLAEVKKMYDGKAIVNVIDINDNPEEANKYGIRVIPTQIFLDKDGKEVFRHEGFFSKEEIAKVFKNMGVE
ncbi:thioredoxin family protein [Clostridium algoriphilum]|uniref:thioredoxin family protein n=1 Tax=Clostridium algoriphilum TaxID=198347 RepID=UPI001CF11004|nr:thioredoxin family protein [Clostridium algoriphilum]MCB2294526.1 thioredoxin family protein [Clostridium algoriphilum]